MTQIVRWTFVLLLLAGCRTAPKEAPKSPAPRVDPTVGEVLLEAEEGWRAALILDNRRTGVWTVKVLPFFDIYGSPEVIGLDDLGRCFVMTSYSGKWYPMSVLRDGWWLGGLAHGDVDPRIPGKELYTGGKLGHLYQVLPHDNGLPTGRLVAEIPGAEMHTILAGDLDAANDGPEVLVFSRPGGLYRVTPTGEHGTFEWNRIADVTGRIRDAVVLPEMPGEPRRIVTCSRTGHLRELMLTKDGPVWETIHTETMGMGRLAMRPDGRVLYTTLDDGRVLRHERTEDRFKTETIFLGPQGPRGLAVGRFGEDPKAESVAVAGYSGEVFVLTRVEKKWKVETIFRDDAQVHWLSTGELDGRNSTDELVLSGFGGRIIMLFRPPGYGRMEATKPE